MNNKAISAIVTTVLIILITVSAATIIWVGVVPMINNGLAGLNTNVDLSLVSSDGYTVWDEENRLVTVQVKRGVDDADIIGFDIIFNLDGDSVTHFVDDMPGFNEKRVYYINLSGYSGDLDSIKIVPIFIDGVVGKVVAELKINKIATGDLVEMVEDDLIEDVEFVAPSGSGGGGSGGSGEDEGEPEECVSGSCGVDECGFVDDGCGGTIDCGDCIEYPICEPNTYYVDFENGDDSNYGNCSTNAWKHSPGDDNAEGNASLIILQPGDTVAFKGGVSYPGELTIMSSGTISDPIVFDGNSDNNWGIGMAIFDGSEKLDNWIVCQSATECGDNPNWANIHYVSVPYNISVFEANLHENGNRLGIAQSPNQPNFYYSDNYDYFYNIDAESITTTSITDPSVFNQTDVNFWDGSSILSWVDPNVISRRDINSFIPSENKITYDTTNTPSGYEKYAIHNSLHAIDKPGEYFFSSKIESDGNRRIYLWPLNSDINNQDITISTRRYGLNINGQSNLDIKGFKIQKFSSGLLREGTGIGTVTYTIPVYNIKVSDNFITRNLNDNGGYGGIYLTKCRDCIVENNIIKENINHRGIFIQGTLTDHSKNITVNNNTVIKCGGTGIGFYYVEDAQITNNAVYNNSGTHANGITVYLFSSNVLIENNTIINSNIGLTLQESVNISVKRNLIDGQYNTDMLSAVWGADYYGQIPYGLSFEENTMVRASGYNGFHISSALDSGGYLIEDNILHGHIKGTSHIYRNNLYVEDDSSDTSFVNGEIYESNIGNVFVDPDNSDFRLLHGTMVGTIPNSVDPCYMSSINSYVGTIPCIGCVDSNPIAIIKSDKITGYEPLEINFDALDSLQCSAAITEYSWNFDDGNSAIGDGVSHIFNAGSYDVTLNILDSNSNSAIAHKNIYVLPSLVPNLNAYFNFDNNLFDSSGKNNLCRWYIDETITTTSSYAIGIKNQAMSSNGGVLGIYTRIDDNSDIMEGMLDGMDELTLSVWVKKNAPDSSEAIIYKHISYALFVSSTGMRGDVYNLNDVRSSQSILDIGNQDTNWHYYALTYNGATVKLYFDGIQINENALIGQVDRNPSRDIYLGKDPWGDSFNGLIDEFRIYDRTLSASEIQTLYNI